MKRKWIARKGDPKASQPPKTSEKGFTLIEGLISIMIMAGVGLLLTSAFSFSIASQEIARLELESARSAGQILEILRGTSYDSLTEVYNGDLDMDPLGQFQQLILADISDRLERNNLDIYLTIQPYQGRAEMKIIQITIASDGVEPDTQQVDLPPGKVLVRQTTLVTERGINP